jgi:ABC-type uncharacterized transport system YnjBCD substrate-binding protein
MKIILSLIITTFLFNACKDKKQRDTRKLSWYEINADARNKNVEILVEESSEDELNNFLSGIKENLKSKFYISVTLKKLTKVQLQDSLLNMTSAGIVMCAGEELQYAINQHLLFGPFDKLIPFGKEEFSKSDSFRISEGVATQGFAVPLKSVLKANNQPIFLALPLNTKNQAGALVVLNTMLFRAENKLLSPSNEL